MTDPEANADLRQLGREALERLGQQSLREHLLAQAAVAHQKYAPLTAGKLEAFLQDPDCLRYPVRLVFEFGEMALHQFAQPDIDWRNTDRDGRVIYLRPRLREHPELLPLAVSYMVSLVNYGEVVGDDHCRLYGAALLGLMEEEYYRKLCDMSDLLGAETRLMGSEPACGG